MITPLKSEEVEAALDERTTEEGKEYFYRVLSGEEGSIDDEGRMQVLRALSEISWPKRKHKRILRYVGQYQECMPQVLDTEIIANLIFDSDADVARQAAGKLLQTEPVLRPLPYTDGDDSSGWFRGADNHRKIPLLIIRYNQPGLLQDWIDQTRPVRGEAVADPELQRAAKSACRSTDCLEILIDELDPDAKQLTRALLNYLQETARHLLYEDNEGWTTRKSVHYRGGEVYDLLKEAGLTLDNDGWAASYLRTNRRLHPFVRLLYKMDQEMNRYVHKDKGADDETIQKEVPRIFEPVLKKIREDADELTEENYKQLVRFVALEHNDHPPADWSLDHREQVIEKLQENYQSKRIGADEMGEIIKRSSDERYLRRVLSPRRINSIKTQSKGRAISSS